MDRGYNIRQATIDNLQSHGMKDKVERVRERW